MFEQKPLNWFEAIAQDTLAEFNFNVSRILFNTQLNVWCAQLDHAQLYDRNYAVLCWAAS